MPSSGIARAHDARAMLFVLCLFQFFHWFKPSEPFVASFAEQQFNISQDQVFDVFGFDVAFQILAGLIIGSLFFVVGYKVALVYCSIMSALTIVDTLIFDQIFAFYLSQFFWASSFTAIYIVLATLLHFLPRRQFQTATSWNSFSTLMASFVSSITGFFMLFTFDATSTKQMNGTNSDEYRVKLKNVFYVSLTSEMIALSILVIAICCKLFVRNERNRNEISMTSSPKKMVNLRIPKKMCTEICNLGVWMWILMLSIVRGVHTEVVTLWQLLASEIDKDPNAEKYNGLIRAGAYAFAGVLVLLPAQNMFEGFIQRHLRLFCLLVLTFASGLLIIMSQTQAILSLGITYITFHGLVEVFMAVGTTQLAKSATSSNEDSYFQKFITLMTIKYFMGLLVEVLVQILFWPKWGAYQNIFGLKLKFRLRLLVLGFVFATSVVVKLVYIGIGSPKKCKKCPMKCKRKDKHTRSAALLPPVEWDRG